MRGSPTIPLRQLTAGLDGFDADRADPGGESDSTWIGATKSAESNTYSARN